MSGIMFKTCLGIVLLICCDGLLAQNVSNSYYWGVQHCGYALGLVMNELNLLGHLIIEKEVQLQSKLYDLSSKIDSLMQQKCNTTTLPVFNGTKDDVYSSCKETPTTGVYMIQPEKPFKEPITVLCDQEYESGGWIVVQHRFDGSTNFYRNWKEYKNGFGNLNGEFWLGLDRIYQLTVSQPYELVVLLEDFDDNKTFARYDQFEIADENQMYMLSKIEGFSGPAGDSLGNAKGMKFSTLDSDNDIAKDSCAVTFTGAWWYNACHASNLNGQYLRGKTTECGKGMVWDTFRGHCHSLKMAKMMIRPKGLQA